MGECRYSFLVVSNSSFFSNHKFTYSRTYVIRTVEEKCWKYMSFLEELTTERTNKFVRIRWVFQISNFELLEHRHNLLLCNISYDHYYQVLIPSPSIIGQSYVTWLELWRFSRKPVLLEPKVSLLVLLLFSSWLLLLLIAIRNNPYKFRFQLCVLGGYRTCMFSRVFLNRYLINQKILVSLWTLIYYYERSFLR